MKQIDEYWLTSRKEKPWNKPGTIEDKAMRLAQKHGTPYESELAILKGEKRRFIAADGTVCKNEKEVDRVNTKIRRQIQAGIFEFSVWKLADGEEYVNRITPSAPVHDEDYYDFDAIYKESKQELLDEIARIDRAREIESTMKSLMEEYAKLTNYQK